jgi:tetratricopeptide (TPR) repeat protein
MSTPDRSAAAAGQTLAACFANMQRRAAAVPLQPATLEAISVLAHARLGLGQLAEAQQMFTILTLHAPASTTYRYGLARARQLSGDPDGAQRDYMLAIALGALSPAFDLRIAECQAALGQSAQALETIHDALARIAADADPASAEVREQLTRWQTLLGGQP